MKKKTTKLEYKLKVTPRSYDDGSYLVSLRFTSIPEKFEKFRGNEETVFQCLGFEIKSYNCPELRLEESIIYLPGLEVELDKMEIYGGPLFQKEEACIKMEQVDLALKEFNRKYLSVWEVSYGT